MSRGNHPLRFREQSCSRTLRQDDDVYTISPEGKAIGGPPAVGLGRGVNFGTRQGLIVSPHVRRILIEQSHQVFALPGELRRRLDGGRINDNHQTGLAADIVCQQRRRCIGRHTPAS